MSNIFNDLYYADIQMFCEEHGVNPHHVLHDGKGKYIMVESEQEDCSIIKKKVYLPKYLQDYDE